MDSYKQHTLYLTLFVFVMSILACNDASQKDRHIASDLNEMNLLIAENIKSSLSYALDNNGKLDDSIALQLIGIVNSYYNGSDHQPVWSSKEKWMPLGDSLFNYIKNAEQDGLFPASYHFNYLKTLKNKLDTDPLKRKDAVLWGRADLMLTDAFMGIIKDLKQGRLQPDSTGIDKDLAVTEKFYLSVLRELIEKKTFTTILNSVQPRYRQYWDLKKGIKHFLDSMDRRTYTYLTYPYKKGNATDSALFIKALQKRLGESGCIDAGSKLSDSLGLTMAIKKYQRQKGLTVDGKISAALVRKLNISDVERFKRIAITLDRYKLLPQKMPDRFIWVNLPAYYLEVWDNDTLALISKIICGKPETRTPVLTSEITDMLTYPTWTVPTSIISKQYLPKLKNNPNYLTKIGLKLITRKGETISGNSVDWSRYSKGIPFKVMQNSGDNNALGVFKFNFDTPYAVYLHDTNQRYLFKNSSRALSHGCVRVQEWEKLAFYIARNDSLNARSGDTLRYTIDSIRNWIANKDRHRMEVKSRLPLYIYYFSCEGKEGKVKFYDDIYGEDKVLRERYFANNY